MNRYLASKYIKQTLIQELGEEMPYSSMLNNYLSLIPMEEFAYKKLLKEEFYYNKDFEELFQKEIKLFYEIVNLHVCDLENQHQDVLDKKKENWMSNEFSLNEHIQKFYEVFFKQRNGLYKQIDLSIRFEDIREELCEKYKIKKMYFEVNQDLKVKTNSIKKHKV